MPPALSAPDRGTKAGRIRVLIVDDDVNLRFAIERRLRKGGIETGSATTVRHAIDRIRDDPYDVVLCDLRIPGGDGSQLLRWLGSFSPSTKVIVVCESLTPEFEAEFPESERLQVMTQPVDLEALVTSLDEMGPRRGFFGNSIEVEFFDYVQMIALTGRDKLVEVKTPYGTGRLWFEHGDIVHVEYDDYRGEMAFYRLTAINRGTFAEVFWRDPPKRTIMRSSTHLLMEAARRADEGLLDDVVSEAEAKANAVSEAAPEPAVAPPPSTGLEAKPIETAVPSEVVDETSFADLNDEAESSQPGEPTPLPMPTSPGSDSIEISIGVDDDPEFLEPDVIEALEDEPPPAPPSPPPASVVAPASASLSGDEGLAADPGEEALADPGVPAAGHAIFEDPDTRQVMLEQFWQFPGINGVAIISSTGKVLAEDMRSNSSLVTLAGFYMRGAARIARTLGYNVFDGVVARSMNGQQMVMVSMGAASAVLSVAPDHDPELVRDAVMGVE